MEVIEIRLAVCEIVVNAFVVTARPVSESKQARVQVGSRSHSQECQRSRAIPTDGEYVTLYRVHDGDTRTRDFLRK